MGMRSMKRSSPLVLPYLSGHTLRANSGATSPRRAKTMRPGTPILRHVAALLSGLLSQSKFGPLLQKARLGTHYERTPHLPTGKKSKKPQGGKA